MSVQYNGDFLVFRGPNILGNKWQSVTGRLRSISVGLAGVWGLSPRNEVLLRDGTFQLLGEAEGSGWTKVEGIMKAILENFDENEEKITSFMSKWKNRKPAEAGAASCDKEKVSGCSVAPDATPIDTGITSRDHREVTEGGGQRSARIPHTATLEAGDNPQDLFKQQGLSNSFDLFSLIFFVCDILLEKLLEIKKFHTCYCFID